MHIFNVVPPLLQLFQLREQQSKQRHSSGEDSKLSKTGSVESSSQPSDGENKEPGKPPKVSTCNLLVGAKQ